MDDSTVFQRAVTQRLVTFWSMPRRRFAAGVRLMLAVCLAGAVFSASGPKVVAHDNNKNKNNQNSDFERKMREMQAEMERQRREQERNQRNLQRAAEEAQKAAEREARKRQEEMERDMRREQERMMREAERAREAAMRDAMRAQERSQREQEQRIRDAERDAQKAADQARRAAEEDQRKQALRDQKRQQDDARRRAETPQEDDGADDPNLNDFERRAKALDAERKRQADQLARDQDSQLKLDEDRARRDRDRDAGQRVIRKDAPAPVALPNPSQPSSAKPWVDGKAPWAKAPASPPADRAPNTAALPKARLPTLPAPVPVTYPGKDKGAELPADLFAKARQGEFVVPALSPADVKKLTDRGFEVSEPAPAGGKAAVQRVRGAGYDVNEAERELHKALQTSVMQNFAYSIFLGSLGETDPGAPEKRAITPATRQPCPDAVCFGGKFINWSRAAGACAKSAKIGIIDTSFDTGHPAFTGLKATSRAFLDHEKPSPYDWHGTAVLSLLAGNPDTSTPGLAPGAHYFLATAFRSDITGNASTDTVRLLGALAWLEESKVNIINMSFSGPQDPAIARAIARMSKKGIVFVAAAGNMGPNAPPSYPAAYPQVIAVTAINRKGNTYTKANRGAHIDVSAPGVDVVTALPKAQQGYRTGTSFAAPFVTAILATQGDLAFTGAKAKLLPKLSVRDLGPPGRDPMYGSGLAMAPATCGDGTAIAADDTVPTLPRPVEAASDAWGAKTTLMRAGAGP
jgi:subtilisin family serine protease